MICVHDASRVARPESVRDRIEGERGYWLREERVGAECGLNVIDGRRHLI